MTTMIFAVIIALLPAVIVGWQGFRLRRQLSSPTLAEQWWQLRTRLIPLLTVACALLFLLVGLHALWLFPVAGVATLAAGFSARRAILGESWGFGRYLLWLLRVGTVFAGPWVLMLLAPPLIGSLGPLNPWLIGGFALALLLRLVLRAGALARILGAAPLAEHDHPDLQSFAAQLAERSPALSPELMRLDLQGGKWANAVALVDRHAPRVVISDQLFELLSEAELRAVYAHELAHVEHYTPRRLRGIAVGMWALTLFGLGLAPLAASFELPMGVVQLLWVALLFAITVVRGNSHQKHEADSDLRALELCDDPQALISSLSKMHVAARVPRRLDAEQERRMSHPSLARRIQAIRSAAGISETRAPEANVTASPAEAPPHETDSGSSFTVASIAGGAGRYLLFEHDRLSWLEGVPSEAVGDPNAMRSAARSLHSSPYRELSELRLVQKAGGATQLVTADHKGRRSTTPVNPADAAALQEALDRVDSLLVEAPPPTALARFGASPVLARLTAAVLFFTTIFLPGGLIATGLAAVTVFLPRAVWLIGTALATLTSLLLARLEPSPLFGMLGGSMSAIHGVILIEALLLLALGFARAVSAPEDRGRWAWLAPALLTGATVFIWVAILGGAWLFSDGSGLDLYRLHLWVAGSGLVLVAPLSAAGAWLAAARPRRWIFAAIPILALLPAWWIGSEGFRDAYVHDPFIAHAPLAEIGAPLHPRLLWESETAGSAMHFRLSPDGSRLAFCGGRADGSKPEGWLLLEKGEDLGRRAAVDLQLGADGSLLAIVPDGEIWRLRLFGDESDWNVTLPELDSAALAFDSTSDLWVVTGHRETALGQELVRLEGFVGGEAQLETRLEIEEEYFWPGSVTWLGSAGALRQSMLGYDDMEELSPWKLWFAGSRTRFEFIDPEGGRPLPQSRLDILSCRTSSPGEENALCLANDGDRVHLWELEAGHLDEPRHLLSFMARFAGMNAASADWIVFGALGKTFLLNRSRNTLHPLELNDDQEYHGAVVALSTRALAVSERSIGRHRIAVYSLIE